MTGPAAPSVPGSGGAAPLLLQKLGGNYHLHIEGAADLESIERLDDALWMVTGLPIATLNCDQAFLKFVDSDGNGRVRSDEIRAAIHWLLSALRDRSRLGAAGAPLSLAAIDDSQPQGRAMLAAARRILFNLDLPAATDISLQQVRDHRRATAGALISGDGIITAESVGPERAELSAFIASIVACGFSGQDGSGRPGVGEEHLRAFMVRARVRVEWLDRGMIPEGQDRTEIMIWGPDTAPAYTAASALWDKLDEFFALSELAAVDARVGARPALSDRQLAEIEDAGRAGLEQRLLAAPLARPNPTLVLDLDGETNPHYAAQLRELRQCVLAPASPRHSGRLTRDLWEEIKRTLGPYREWQALPAARDLAAVGEHELRALLDGPLPGELQDLLDQDRAVAEDLKAAGDLEKLILYQQHLLELANNTVSLPAFYDPEQRSLVEAGTLVMDGRRFRLCVRVPDRAAHKRVAVNSRICLMYLEVRGRDGAERFEVAAAVTAGEAENLCAGKYGVFFTVDGREWDAQVLEVVPNPVSLAEALRDPFKRLSAFLGNQWEKLTSSFYSDTEKQLSQGIDSAQKAPPAVAQTAPPAQSNRAGAARDLLVGGSIALAAMGGLAAYVTKTIDDVGLFGVLKIVAAVLLLILVTSLISGIIKLRRRNLGMFLEACGWAVNRPMRLTPSIGRLFTFVPPYPAGTRRKRIDGVAALARRLPGGGGRWLRWLVCLVLAAAAGTGIGWLLCHRYVTPWIASALEAAPQTGPAWHAGAGPEVTAPAARPGKPAESSPRPQPRP